MMDVEGDSPQFPAILHINVGGVRFTTALETLQGLRFGADSGDGGSMIAAMFSGRMPTRRDSEGRFFIDRDGRHFHHILNYLRDGTFPAPLSATERLELEREASYYGVQALAAHLRADLQVATPKQTFAHKDGDADLGDIADVQLDSHRVLSASDAAETVLNSCLDEWPEFPQYVQRVLDQVLAAGGVSSQDSSPTHQGMAAPAFLASTAPNCVVFDATAAANLQTNSLAAAQIELAHNDAHSSVWRWSDRKTGVNNVLRAKLLRCHLQRLGYICSIVPVLDKKEVTAYVLQVELPMPR